jgi:hypothetical protein
MRKAELFLLREQGNAEMMILGCGFGVDALIHLMNSTTAANSRTSLDTYSEPDVPEKPAPVSNYVPQHRSSVTGYPESTQDVNQKVNLLLTKLKYSSQT